MTLNRSIETKLVQLGNLSDPTTGAVSPPIHLSTAYKHAGIGNPQALTTHAQKIQLVLF